MEVCLSHWSALQAWRHIRSLGLTFTNHMLGRRHLPVKSLGFTAGPHELASLRNNYGLKTIDALVLKQAKRHRRLCVAIRCLPTRADVPAVFEIEHGIKVTAPESVFMHLSGALSTLGLVALGYELCSIYAINANGCIEESVPLTTVNELVSALDQAVNKQRAQRALRYVVERSRSPRETEASMKLTLPYKMGGYMQSGLLLNAKVSLGEEGRHICGKSFCFPDMLYPDSKLVFEYDGVEYHEGRAKEDELRRLALEREGYRIERIGYSQLKSREEMRLLANIASVVNKGHSIRINASNWDAASRSLYATLSQEATVSNRALWTMGN